MKIIFLDLDGPIYNNGVLINDALHCLNELIRLTGAKIVITSDRRIGKNLGQVKDLIYATLGENISKEVIGITKVIYYNGVEVPRAAEIQYWLDSSSENITRYVIIDENESAALLSSAMNFVKVGDAGITGEVFRNCLRILG